MKKMKILSLIGSLVFSMSLIGATYAQTTPTNNTINVQAFGATGNDKTDDTAKIQSAIDSASKSGKVVDIPKGDYYINPNVGLFMKNNTTLNFDNGARLISLPTSNGYYGIIKALGVSNVKVTGSPTIIGDRNVHTGTTGEWGMGIIVNSSNGIYIENANISNCWGDGIYIGVISSQSQQYSKDITLKNVNLDNNRRQGISVISAINLDIESPTITNTNGTDPQSGIDFEPNNPNEYVQNVTVTNPIIQNNAKDGLHFWFGFSKGSTNPVSINIANSSGIKNNGNKDINFYSTGLGAGQIMVDGKNLYLSGSPVFTQPTQTTQTTQTTQSTQPTGDLQKQVDDLKAQNATLQSQVKSLTDENNTLKSNNNKLSAKLANIQKFINQ